MFFYLVSQSVECSWVETRLPTVSMCTCLSVSMHLQCEYCHPWRWQRQQWQQQHCDNFTDNTISKRTRVAYSIHITTFGELWMRIDMGRMELNWSRFNDHFWISKKACALFNNPRRKKRKKYYYYYYDFFLSFDWMVCLIGDSQFALLLGDILLFLLVIVEWWQRLWFMRIEMYLVPLTVYATVSFSIQIHHKKNAYSCENV